MLFVPLTANPMPRAVDHAVALADANAAELSVFGVVPEAPRLQRGLQLGNSDESVTDLLATSLSATLQQWMDGGHARRSVNVAVEVGRAPLEVVRRVLRFGHDLVMLASDGSMQSAATARRVVRSCPCPVWILRPTIEDGGVLAAIDPDDSPELSRLILELASSQAARQRRDVRVVHAWDVSGESALEGSPFVGVGARELADFSAAVEAEHRRGLHRVLDAANGGWAGDVHLINGPPARSINGLAELYRVNLLVMGSIGHRSVDGVAVGDTAEQVLATAGCSVLVVKPPGFVSPVRLSEQ